eukprot:TRINITY_DN13848_c0_g1_i1.p1 TRINITY_DN13848_c0_g1~~TRINITY_DN13848_c0_g1_i1.p1  ORF type:complete len:313 (+),score=60.47 TRINITY_DN13848_c0_g1_i1:57-995(+)
MSVERLKERFGKADFITFMKGRGGLDLVVVKLPSGTSFSLVLQGAHLVSFVDEEGMDLIFLSSKASFTERKAIRGGVPICFPQFGPGSLPQHGFARTSSDWVVTETRLSEDHNEASVTLLLKDNPTTRQTPWPFRFTLELRTHISYNATEKSRLKQILSVTNDDERQFTFTTALHNYFCVPDVEQSSVVGLVGLDYYDRLHREFFVEQSEHVRFPGPVDRTYHSAPNKITITGGTGGSRIFVTKENFPDVVVWNCWEEGAKAMADMGDEDYKNYVCCEVGAVGRPVPLAPNETWKASQTLWREGSQTQESKY